MMGGDECTTRASVFGMDVRPDWTVVGGQSAGGMAAVRRGHQAYQYMRDVGGDGVVCET